MSMVCYVTDRWRLVRMLPCVLTFVASSTTAVAEDLDPVVGSGPPSEAVEQIRPSSPVAGGNDPAASNDVLYVLQEDEDDAAEILENEKGIIGRGGRPVGQKRGGRTHFFVNPSARVAGKYVFSKGLTFEAFLLGGVGMFREDIVSFGTQATNVSGGVSAAGDFGFANGIFAYEHRNGFARTFATLKSTGEKFGATFNRTFPFFVPRLTITPQVVAARDIVNPINGSVTSVEATAGLTYDFNTRVSVAASAGYGAAFLYRLPGYRHDNGLKALAGMTVKPFDGFAVTLGASMNRTTLYGLPRYRADDSLSPNLNLKYTFLPTVTVSLATSYVRFISNTTGSSTFKYNINPSINISVPL